MRAADAVVEILKREGVTTLFCFPTTSVIETAVAGGLRPIICRQERVGVDMADGYARVTNGKPPGVFAMQYGPGAENAFPGIATTYSDLVPVLFLPLGHAREQAQVFPMFHASRTYASVTKQAEQILVPEQVPAAMRRAFSQLKNGRPGPVMVELPRDVLDLDIGSETLDHRPVRPTRGAPAAHDVDEAARLLLDASCPVILAGQGVLYAEASDELVRLAELLQSPVMTTVDGKSAFPENHALALGSGGNGFTGHGAHFLYSRADLILGIGTGLNRHPLTTPPLPGGVRIIHATNDTRDLHKSYATEVALLGDAKLVLAALVDAVTDRLRRAVTEPLAGGGDRDTAGSLAGPLAGKTDFVGKAHNAVPRHQRVHARGGSGRRDRHTRLGQPARAVAAVLSCDAAARLSGLGQVASARHRAGPDDRREGGRAGQVLRELHGRCGVRHDRAGLRNRGALRRADLHDRAEQLDDGDRDSAHEAVAREAQCARPWWQLRQPRTRSRRLERAGGGSVPGGRGDPACPASNGGGQGVSARIRHQCRDGVLETGGMTRRR